MPETPNDDIWREEEHEDSCSCSSHLYLVSSSSTEIITVPADLVPLVQGVVDRTFLMERLLSAIQHNGTVNVQQYVNRMERIGGASGSDTDRDTAQTPEPWAVQYTDDTVMVHETDQDSMQDTDSTQIQDTNSAQTQETYSDQTQDTAQETKDTQDT